MSDIFAAMNRKVVVITGASSGLGKELTKIYAQKNYNLVINVRNKKKVPYSNQKNIDIVVGDLRDEKTITSISEIVIKKYKRIDILINNAGILYIQPFESNTRDQFDEIFAINVKAHMLLTQKFFSVMKKNQSGHIVNIISTAGKEGKLNHTLYCASKYALSGFTDSLRLEAKKHKIKVTGIYPGGMKTNIFNKISKKIDESTFMEPKNVAKAIFNITDLDYDVSPDSLVLTRLASPTSSLYEITNKNT